MAQKDRTGNRKTCEQRKPFKVPELGYYLIVTDTEATERCYFEDFTMHCRKMLEIGLLLRLWRQKPAL